jgi:hypothetical protein
MGFEQKGPLASPGQAAQSFFGVRLADHSTFGALGKLQNCEPSFAAVSASSTGAAPYAEAPARAIPNAQATMNQRNIIVSN